MTAKKVVVPIDMDQKRAWFASYLNDGEDDALFAILESERDGVYDFLVRLGVPHENLLPLLEKLPAPIIAAAPNISELDELRVFVYKSARQQAIAYASKTPPPLENFAYRDGTQPKDPMEIVLVRTVENLVMEMPPGIREQVVLHFIHNFSAADIAKITELSEKEVGENLAVFISDHQISTGISGTELLTTLQQIPLHPIKTGSGISTVALSQVVGDLRKARPRRISRKMILLCLFILIGLAGIYYVYRPF